MDGVSYPLKTAKRQLIQITDHIPKALIPFETGQWARMEKLLIDNVKRLQR